jgi:hypothetical protein
LTNYNISYGYTGHYPFPQMFDSDLSDIASFYYSYELGPSILPSFVSPDSNGLNISPYDASYIGVYTIVVEITDGRVIGKS